MGHSIIEGMIRQSTNNKIMDTQLKNYIILKNGNQMDFTARDLNGAIKIIRQLESHINRLTEHSPYTIGRL
jgi:hypothetical protein